MSPAIRISIIIPCYNEERYLRRCLDSIAAQTMQPFEVLLVDNDSDDASATVAATYPFVTVLHEPARGRVYARNAGFRAATGDILARIDADAVLPPHWVEYVTTFYASAEHMNVAWTGGAAFYNVRLPRVVSWLYNTLVFRCNALFTGYPSLWGSNMALPASLWNIVENEVCLRNDVHEDLDLTEHLHRHGSAIRTDVNLKVGVQLRRVRSDRGELWSYLQMWPQTLRVHANISWPICWVTGALLPYLASPLFVWSERVARLFGRPPLDD